MTMKVQSLTDLQDRRIMLDRDVPPYGYAFVILVGIFRFKADSEASSKALYEAYQRWCEDNAQKPMSANRLSS